MVACCSRSRLAAYQYGSRAVGDLVDLVVDFAHAAAIADEVARVIAVPELLPQTTVFRHQAPAFFHVLANPGDAICQEGGNQFQELEILLQFRIGRHRTVDAHSADYPALVDDRHAQECHVALFARPRAIEEVGVRGNVPDQGGSSGFGHATRDAFPKRVAASLLFLRGQAA